MARWLATDLRELVHDCLEVPDSRLGEYLDRACVADMVLKRTPSRRNWTYVVYGLLVLELWLREVAQETRTPVLA
jgi:hypothetical protein